MGGISIWQLLIIAVIVVLLLAPKSSASIGSDLGASGTIALFSRNWRYVSIKWHILVGQPT